MLIYVREGLINGFRELDFFLEKKKYLFLYYLDSVDYIKKTYRCFE